MQSNLQLCDISGLSLPNEVTDSLPKWTKILTWMSCGTKHNFIYERKDKKQSNKLTKGYDLYVQCFGVLL